MEIKVLNRQSILDISIQYTGDVQKCFDIAIANGMSVSDLLASGTQLIIPDEIEKNPDVINYYTSRLIKPATGTTLEQENQLPTLKGIGYMQIGNTFKVS
ncbi:hypothetical protein C1637_18585 [Chryseobacterium lactis]|uniref:LysM domain-containing protein n=1 Tax=Chryseobacterium lactis TaxID=1241981 RepID=A0A3G6RPL9_CHRLC|nr:hypothetical protein [Chryseobacterium lactis]AZA84790.1 hypothetical protein EG342_24095 [Chryseobacterium lactis]AZB05179.1 hypothetical protein EG341_14975 [Chryseobacterium lactis]PNW12161.1 hypothetical protein C1637_18585 [Chryseobacterium lactis]